MFAGVGEERGSEESSDCLASPLIQGVQLKHTFPPWVAFFQRRLRDSEAQAPPTSSLVQNTAAQLASCPPPPITKGGFSQLGTQEK